MTGTYVCAHCRSQVLLANCAFCRRTNTVLPKWKTFVCTHCGQQTRLRAPGEGLMRAGQAMENAGKAISSLVGTLILLMIIFVVYKGCDASIRENCHPVRAARCQRR
jgi:flagellin-like protein